MLAALHPDCSAAVVVAPVLELVEEGAETEHFACAEADTAEFDHSSRTLAQRAVGVEGGVVAEETGTAVGEAGIAVEEVAGGAVVAERDTAVGEEVADIAAAADNAVEVAVVDAAGIAGVAADVVAADNHPVPAALGTRQGQQASERTSLRTFFLPHRYPIAAAVEVVGDELWVVQESSCRVELGLRWQRDHQKTVFQDHLGTP
jgi:hypothetical protein